MNLTHQPISAAEEQPSTLRRIHAKLSQTSLRVPVLWFRHREIRPADVFLASYPRSGSTWVRFAIYEAVTGEPSEFESVNRSFRPIGDHFNAPGLLPGKGRFIGTHEKYRPEYHRGVYLVRDVRDVALSQFAREREKGIAPETLDEYLIDLLSGHKRHGSWQDHVLSWLNSGLGPDNLLLVRFEDLHSKPQESFGRIMDFLRVPYSEESLRKAIDNNSVQQMRAKEDRLQSNPSVKVVHQPVRRSTAEEGRFVRKGKVGGWRERLTDTQQKLIETHAEEALLRAGYPLRPEEAARDLAMSG